MNKRRKNIKMKEIRNYEKVQKKYEIKKEFI